MGAGAIGARNRRWSLAVGVLVACLALPAAATAKPRKPPSYKVVMTFTQTRNWTYSQQQVGEECSGTSDGNGSDTAKLEATATFNLQPHRLGFAGFGALGDHSRVGTMTHTTGTPNFPGASCGGPPVTTLEPVSGCGPKDTLVQFGGIHLVGKKVLLEWDASISVPDFDCPYFDGSNDATSANALPGAGYRDVIATVNRQALVAAKRKVTAEGTDEISKFESCANLTQGCAEGVTYNASASVTSNVKLVFKPKKR